MAGERAPRGAFHGEPPRLGPTPEWDPATGHGPEHAQGLQPPKDNLLARIQHYADTQGIYSGLPANLKKLAITTAVKTLQTPKDLLLLEARDIGTSREDDPLPPSEWLRGPNTSFLTRYQRLLDERLANKVTSKRAEESATADLIASLAARRFKVAINPRYNEEPGYDFTKFVSGDNRDYQLALELTQEVAYKFALKDQK